MTRRLILRLLTTLPIVIWSDAAVAEKLASVVRGVGAGSDKAAGHVAHQMRRGFQADGRYDVVDLEYSLGNPTREEAHHVLLAAEELTQKGRRAYEVLDLEPAIEYLTTALDKYEQRAALVTDISTVTELLMLLGATHILRGEERTGARWLARAIAVDPAVEPDPRIFNPGMRQIFHEAAARLADRPLGTVSVTSAPSYAEVFLDGRFVGVTPVAVDDVPEGRHFLRLAKQGYRSHGRVIDVNGKVEAVDTISLVPTDNFEELQALVEAATPLLSGKQAGDSVGEVPKQLGQLLEADELMMTEVRLDGEQVHVLAVLVDVGEARVVESASQTFSYDSRPETYEREITDLLRRNFIDHAIAKERREGGAGVAGLARAARKTCYGVPCSEFKTLLLVVGVGGGATVGLLGGLLDYLAWVDNGEYRDAAQLSSEADDLRSSGTAKAISGDILVGLGIVTAAVSVGLYFFWELPPSGVVEQPGSAWGLALVPASDGAALSAHVDF